VRGNPISIVGSSGRSSGAGGSLLSGLSLNALRALSTLLSLSSRLALLREVGSDPNSVEEVTGTGDTSQEEEVEEDAAVIVSSSALVEEGWKMRGCSHLGIEDAGIRLNNADSAIVGSDSEETAFAIGENGRQSQLKVLGVHLGGEAVADRLLGSGGDLDTVASSGQVASNLGLVLGVAKTTSNKVHSHRVRLIVGDGDQCLGRVTVDKLNAKDLRSRERRLRRDSQDRGLCFSLLSIL
jgi:hypothetical protein